jgi:hypothetical protein
MYCLIRQYITYSKTSRRPTMQLGEQYCASIIVLGVPSKLVRLIKMFSNETYSKVHKGKHLSHNFIAPVLQLCH